jgi:hypothetical protein
MILQVKSLKNTTLFFIVFFPRIIEKKKHRLNVELDTEQICGLVKTGMQNYLQSPMTKAYCLPMLVYKKESQVFYNLRIKVLFACLSLK